MRIVMKNLRKRSLTRPRTIISLGSFLIVALLLMTTFSVSAQRTGTTSHGGASFSFTAAGDYGQTNYTTANLTYIAKSGVSFDLALGDFSYNLSTVNAAAWSAYAKGLLPAKFPFEILVGGHDGSQIKTYAADLPNYMSNMTGTYSKQYSFDYPSSGPLARFIMVSPGGSGNYNKGTSGYNWVSQMIDGARAAKIHWVIVAMHQYCFVIGSASCNGQDL